MDRTARWYPLNRPNNPSILACGLIRFDVFCVKAISSQIKIWKWEISTLNNFSFFSFSVFLFFFFGSLSCLHSLCSSFEKLWFVGVYGWVCVCACVWFLFLLLRMRLGKCLCLFLWLPMFKPIEVLCVRLEPDLFGSLFTQIFFFSLPFVQIICIEIENVWEKKGEHIFGFEDLLNI